MHVGSLLAPAIAGPSRVLRRAAAAEPVADANGNADVRRDVGVVCPLPASAPLLAAVGRENAGGLPVSRPRRPRGCRVGGSARAPARRSDPPLPLLYRCGARPRLAGGRAVVRAMVCWLVVACLRLDRLAARLQRPARAGALLHAGDTVPGDRSWHRRRRHRHHAPPRRRDGVDRVCAGAGRRLDSADAARHAASRVGHAPRFRRARPGTAARRRRRQHCGDVSRHACTVGPSSTATPGICLRIRR